MGLFDKLKNQKQQEETSPVLDDLKKIGDEAGVNPPPDEEDGAPPPLVVEHEEVKKEEGPGGTCPTCGKFFKHLSRHKCKAAEGRDPQAPPKDTKVPTQEKAKAQKERPGEHFRRGPDWKFKHGDQVWLDSPIQVLSAWGRDDDRMYHVELVPSCGTAEKIKPINFDVKENEIELYSKKISNAPKESAANDESVERAPSFSLFLDCEVVTSEDLGEWQYLDDYLRTLKEVICKENQVEHWKCVEFGKGPGLLAARLQRKLEADSDIGILVCDTQTAEFRACSGVLRMFAKNIVVGTK